MLKDYSIVGSYNNQRISAIDAERTVNMFEFRDPKGKKPNSLISTSGLSNTNLVFMNDGGGLETGGSRATYVFNTDLSNQEMYQVFGGSFYQINQIGNSLGYVRRGSLTTSQGYVGMTSNQYQIILVDGSQGFIYDTEVDVFLQILDPGFPTAPLDVAILDGFFVAIQRGTDTFNISEINDGLIWSELESEFTIAAPPTSTLNLTTPLQLQTLTKVEVFATGGTLPTGLSPDTDYWVIRISDNQIQLAASKQDAVSVPPVPIVMTGAGSGTFHITNNGELQQGQVNSNPGTLVACRTLHRQLFFFCQNFTEVWVNAGAGSNLPFRRNNQLLMEYGAVNASCVTVGFDMMCFLSQDSDGLGSVMKVVGSQAIPISNLALDYQLAQYASEKTNGVSNVNDAWGFLVKENGLIFYRLSFTVSNHTFVYNATISTPQEPLWHEEETLLSHRHPAQTHGYFNGVNYVGAYNNATLYVLDDSNVTNNGETIKRMRIGAPVTPDTYQRLRCDRFHLDLVQGQIFNEILEFDEVEILLENGTDILTTENGVFLITETDELTSNNSNPIVYMSISKDGGISYGYRIEAKMGATGQRTYRTVWRKLGTIPRGQSFIPKFEFFAKIPFTIMGAAWFVEVMPE